MMSNVCLLFLLYIFASESISFATIPEADIVVNVENGFILQRIGTYSHKITEGIIHTFVPVNDLCKSLAGTDVYLRASRLKGNSIELGTILSIDNKHWPSGHYEKKRYFCDYKARN